MSDSLNPRVSTSKRHTDNRAKWAVMYYLTGDAEKAIELTSYQGRVDPIKLIDWYKELDLPVPVASGSDLLDSVVAKLSTDQLAAIIVEAAQSGKDNRIATQLIELYQARERQNKAAKYDSMGVDQRVRTVLADEDFQRVLLTWMSREYISKRLLTNPAYWAELPRDIALQARKLIDKALESPGKDKAELEIVRP